jgi:hypothetical protein
VVLRGFLADEEAGGSLRRGGGRFPARAGSGSSRRRWRRRCSLAWGLPLGVPRCENPKQRDCPLDSFWLGTVPLGVPGRGEVLDFRVLPPRTSGNYSTIGNPFSLSK